MTPERRQTRSHLVRGGLAAGLALAATDVLAAGVDRVPARLLVAEAALGLVVGLAAGLVSAAARRPLALGGVLAFGASLNALSLVSKGVDGPLRVPALVLALALSLAAGLACTGAPRRGAGAAFLLVGSVPAGSLLAWALGGTTPGILLASGVPLAGAALYRHGPSLRGLAPRFLLPLTLTLALTLPALLADRAPVRRDLPPPASPPPAGPPEGAPDVVLVVIDTLRADAIEPGGTIDRLARDGVRFRLCVSAAPWTLPSMGSLLTSLLPSQHGAVQATRPLATDVTTLAEAFRAAGFRTAAFTGGAFVGPAFRMDQGFERFDATAEFGFRPFRIHVPLIWRIAKNRYAPLRALVRWVGESTGFAGVRAAAETWLAERDPAAPCFLLLHTYEVHDYYLYHPVVDDPLLEGPAYEALSPRFRGRLSVHPSELLAASATDLSWFHAVYAARVASVERELAILLEHLRARRERDLVVAVVSDHGEGFDAERGRVHHGGRLHDDLLHVPLVLHAPGRLPAGRTVDALVRTIDVGPTLLDLAGVSPLAEASGRSLLPLVRGTGEPPLEAWSEERAEASAEDPTGGRQVALQRDGWKLVRRGGVPEAFRPASDPLEARPVPDPPPALLERLARFEELFPARTLEATDLDPTTTKHLRDLGYVE